MQQPKRYKIAADESVVGGVSLGSRGYYCLSKDASACMDLLAILVGRSLNVVENVSHTFAALFKKRRNLSDTHTSFIYY